MQQGDTLESIARLYHSNLNALIANTLSLDSTEIELAKGKTILIEQGTYMVPQGTSRPGASFASIALRFGTTVDQLKQINPGLKDENLPAGTPLRLPAIELTIAAKTLSNDLIKLTDLKKIAEYFGTEPIVVAVSNAEQENLLVAGQTLTTHAGPLSVQPGEHPGVQALNAKRAKPQPVPSGGTGSDYAKALLLNNYSLLAYQVTENQDFKSSNMGLPIGASGKSTSPDENKVRYVLEASTGDAEQYHGAISYLGLVKDKGKDKPLNPYIANGKLLQTKLGWNDYYGNTILSSLDDYADPAGKLSNKPALQGYTDQIIPLSQWPSTSASWTVAMSKNPEKTFTLMVSFSFDTSPFIPQKGQNPSIAQQRARSALVIVEDMLTQFDDPNGFAVEVDTSLVSENYTLTDGELKQLIGWWQHIQKFLQKHSAADGNETDPKFTIPSLKLPVTTALSDVRTDQVFELVTKLIFKRTHGIAVGDYAADPLARSVANTVAIKTNVSAPKRSDKEPKKPKPDILAEFAGNVAKAIQGPDFQIMVASGINRYAPSAGLASNATWAVRVGRQEGDPISFRITDECHPELYAALPVSNTLISRSASIYPYTSLEDFDSNG
ncbi:LysM peptidoglycan-binding domain-containing protein [Pseudovibrio denitrificans]|uniref:LysM peptidoglycan-binding domain-containing protein n=1 Tax=Pseudovibrio denitrificans TaxID=258256 RepID=UPI000AEEA7F3|nr:LysM peptidoglycan-binding domain-containing protein [Pseudovibrio denitrificans]